MSKHTLIRCDSCRGDIGTFDGVHIVLKERHVSGAPQRVAPYQDEPERDYCDECFKSVAAELMKLERKEPKQ